MTYRYYQQHAWGIPTGIWRVEGQLDHFTAPTESEAAFLCALLEQITPEQRLAALRKIEGEKAA